MDQLEAEIAAARVEISADTISMSVSELSNLYREGTLEIRPEFQRLFRWDHAQKSRLVESILLGIPLPSFFVAQAESGGWELVDGLQRVSTLLELQGLLMNADGSIRPSLTLSGTKFLPNLEGRTWSSTDPAVELSAAQKLDIRLARLDLRVIKRGSDPKARFDLFQRLNSFGSALTSQEIRSAFISGANADCLSWLVKLARQESFTNCVNLSERLIAEQYDIELVLRFLMLHNRHVARAGLSDFSSRLDDWSVELAADPSSWAQLDDTFDRTFSFLADHGGEDIFRKWDKSRNRFRGQFLNTSFEVIALGAAFHLANGRMPRADIETAARTLWLIPEMNTRFATGLATQDRLVKTLPLGRRLMASPPEEVTAQDLL
ncbi:DUF262 domain-containing protein [Conexibacter arvalis]|uniref:GmrSD restriction endonucleases N-terminal domain-containing protein n=1 Tax=Conexibacter arvalis TaxID=912552 RepID=A0A840IB59_9ACTN|nr:DUF262 domain-containing protein [Conexibacter arvalis]MBB4662129.1 hypothetical protein [Conexibacter arvalis]